jgi:peroxiredoxin
MNTRILSALAVLLATVLGSNLYSAETNAAAPADSESGATNAPDPAFKKDFDNLITKVQAKVDQGKRNETDFAGDFKEFDALIAKYKNATQDERFALRVNKGKLYLMILQDPVKALPIFQQIKNDFPSIQLNGDTDTFLAGVKEEADKKAIRDALVGVPFPDFNEKDIADNDLSVSKYKGKVILLDFWATWCPPCVAEVPEIQKLYNKYHDKGFEVIGISLDIDKSDLERFIKQRKMPWPQYFDGQRFDNKLALKYGITSAPSTFLIGRDGKVIKQIMGPDELDEEIAKAMK